jgi:hypothetical protein
MAGCKGEAENDRLRGISFLGAHNYLSLLDLIGGIDKVLWDMKTSP